MKPATDTIAAIRSALQSPQLTPQASHAAAEYARLCQEASRRLDSIAAILEKGSDYQALQLAEQDPPLLDLIAAVSFGGEKAWSDFCQSHQLPVASRLNAKIVQAVEALYQKGITANHPLYKDFRAAVLSRDDTKALAIVRTILKLNPGDDNARAELERLENKEFQAVLDQLRTVLKQNDEPRIVTLAGTLATLASADELDRNDDYRRAVQIAERLRRREAENQLPELISQIANLQSQGDWQSAAPVVDEVKTLMGRHLLEPPDALKETWQSALLYVQRERAAADKKSEFDRALRAFVSFVEEIEVRLLSAGRLTYDEAAQRDEKFVRQWKHLEAFKMPVANDVLQRLRNAGQELRARLRQIERARRVRAIVAAAAAVIFLAVSAGVAFHAWQAGAYAEELAACQSRGACIPAEKLIQDLRDNHPLKLKWSFLRSRLEDTAAWTTQARTAAAQVDQALQRLETFAKAGFGGAEPATLLQDFDAAAKVLAQLPADLATEPRQRLALLETQRDLHLTSLRQAESKDAGQILADLEAEAGSVLSYDGLTKSAAPKARGLQARLIALEKRLQSNIEALQAPADLTARAQSLRQKVDRYVEHLDHFEKARAQTAAATTLDTYRKHLAEWEDLPFAEAKKAALCLAVLPSEEVYLAKLITAGDLPTWKAIAEDVSGHHFSPSAPTETDIGTLLDLREDDQLNNVWENRIHDYARNSTLPMWSQGPVEQAGAGDIIRWTGLCYEAQPSDGTAAFFKKEFVRFGGTGQTRGQAVLSQKLSATSDFMQSLQISRMTDSNGERYQRPLLDQFDKIVQSKTGSPLAKAYVFLQFAAMAERRSYAWGLHFCPTLTADIRDLRALLGREELLRGDWMVPKKQTLLDVSLGRFFADRAGRAYLNEATARRDLLQGIARAGLRFAGYLETDLSLHLNAEGLRAAELWTLAAGGQQPLCIGNPLLKNSTDPASGTVTGALPLGPVFFVPVDRKQLLARFQTALGPQAAVEAAADQPPFMNLQ
ncbi:MAG TPA: hypothetical protein VD994_02555 [Prosthecobacter sp.]|nr:hypothetical protein [Prosthecobacter sp.]